MGIKVSRYENNGKGFKLVHRAILTDAESKVMVGNLKRDGFVRIKGSGIIGMSFEKNDLEKNTQITFERALEW